MILLPHFDILYGFGLGKIPYNLPFQGPVFFGQTTKYDHQVVWAHANVKIKIFP